MRNLNSIAFHWINVHYCGLCRSYIHIPNIHMHMSDMSTKRFGSIRFASTMFLCGLTACNRKSMKLISKSLKLAGDAFTQIIGLVKCFDPELEWKISSEKEEERKTERKSEPLIGHQHIEPEEKIHEKSVYVSVRLGACFVLTLLTMWAARKRKKKQICTYLSN